MKLIVNKKSNSPFDTLTLEEALIKDDNFDEDIVYLYRHNNAVIIGRNQNAHEEIKRDVIEAQKVDLYRRVSGGGAVYHDMGNIVFSFITKKDAGRSYEKFLEPIIEFLKSLNLEVEFKGRNDLLVNGAKVSGNAQFIYKDRIVHHGTILFNSNLKKLTEILIPNPLKMASKGIKSMRQRVTNIYDELVEKMTVDEFEDRLAKFFVEKYHCKLIELPEYGSIHDDLKALRSSEDWVYGHNPDFEVTNKAKFDNGILEVSFNTSNDHITAIEFRGDFLSKKDIDEILPLFYNVKYRRQDVAEVLEKIDLNDYFGGLQKDEILSLIFG
ncbi:lipoate--protein ligase [Candidatus Mycoplasma pogonae]